MSIFNSISNAIGSAINSVTNAIGLTSAPKPAPLGNVYLTPSESTAGIPNAQIVTTPQNFYSGTSPSISQSIPSGNIQITGGGGGGSSGIQNISSQIENNIPSSQIPVSSYKTNTYSNYNYTGGTPTSELYTTMLNPLTSTYTEITNGRNLGGDISSFGKRTTDFLSNAEQSTTDFLGLTSKEKRQQDLNEQLQQNKTITGINQNVTNFNAKYGNKTLSQEDYTQALKELEQINDAIMIEQSREINKRVYEQRLQHAQETSDPLSYFAPALAKGFVTAPFELGKFAIGLATNPVNEISNTIEGFASLPSQFTQAPASTSGEVLGSLAGQSLVIGALTSPFKEIKLDIPIRDVIEPKFLETAYTDIDLSKGGEPVRTASYKITTEKTPPRIIETTTPARQFIADLLGEDRVSYAKELEFIEPKYSITKTPFYAYNQEPFITQETNLIKNPTSSKLNIISGVSNEIESINKLVNIDKFLFQRLLESETGRPVSLKFESSMLKPEEILTASDIETELIGKFRRGAGGFKELELNYPTKKTNFRAITKTTPIKENDLFELSKSKIVFKELGKNPTIKGRTPTMSGQILEYKEPFIHGETQINSIKPNFNIEKTPLSETFKEELKTQALFQRSKALIPYTKAPITSKLKITTKNLLSDQNILFGGSSLSNSFVGTGQYERTLGGQLPSEVQKNFSLGINKELTKTMQKEINKETLRELDKTINKEIQIEIPRQLLKQNEKQLQKQLLKPSFKNPELSILNPPPTPKRKIFSFNFEEKKKRPRLSTQKLYSVFLRERGNYIPFASGLPIGKARKYGVERTLERPARTFKLKETGYTDIPMEDISFRPNNFLFRSYQIKKGRKIPLTNTFIERNAISTRSEQNILSELSKQARMFSTPKRRRRKR